MGLKIKRTSTCSWRSSTVTCSKNDDRSARKGIRAVGFAGDVSRTLIDRLGSASKDVLAFVYLTRLYAPVIAAASTVVILPSKVLQLPFVCNASAE
jgi:hypothetical protein